MWAASSGQRLQIHHSTPSSALAILWSALCVVTSMVRSQVLNFVRSYVASFLSASFLSESQAKPDCGVLNRDKWALHCTV